MGVGVDLVPATVVMAGQSHVGEEESRLGLSWVQRLQVKGWAGVPASAANRSIGFTTGCTITEKAPTRAFSWLKAPTSAFTFKTLLRHYAKQALTQR